MGLRIVYEPRGRAREYSGLALNHYTGCAFGCRYCFSPRVLKKTASLFHTNVQVREGLFKKLEEDCKTLSGTKERVLLSFVCDPYSPPDQELQATRKVLELFKEYNVPFQILTKGGMAAARDFDLYKPGDAFATTLTFVDVEKSRVWEPGAALPESRIDALQMAFDKGIDTWVSLEPVIDPEETLQLIEITHPFVNLYKVGTLNYVEERHGIDWSGFADRVVATLDKYGKQYLLKDDLVKKRKSPPSL